MGDASIKIVVPSVVCIDDMRPLEKIEYAYRTCYQSRHLMGDGSYKFISKILYPEDGGTPHSSPLEHVHVSMVIHTPKADRTIREWQDWFNNYHLRLYWHPKTNIDGSFMLEGNLRAFFDFWRRGYIPDSSSLSALQYHTNRVLCDAFPIFQRLEAPTEISDTSGSDTISELEVCRDTKSFNIITTRDILQELVRHRTCSFSVESTRYCDYRKKGFTFVRPDPFRWADPKSTNPSMYQLWYNNCKDTADNYLKMLDMGANPEEARMLLPGSLKTELVMSATDKDWQHFLKLRNHKTAHPQIRLIAKEIAKYVG